jgi:hypothetical protein
METRMSDKNRNHITRKSGGSEKSDQDAARALADQMLKQNPEYACRIEAQQAIPNRPLEDIGIEERGEKITNLPLICDEIVPPKIPACVRGGVNHCREA